MMAAEFGTRIGRKAQRPTTIQIAGFAPHQKHTAPGVLGQHPEVGSEASRLLIGSQLIELIRPFHGVVVHGDMSGDLGAAYQGDHPRPDLTAVELAAVLEAAGKSVQVRDEMVNSPVQAPNPQLRLIKVQLPTWRADLVAARQWREADPNVPVVLYGSVLSYLPQVPATMTVRGDAPRAVADLLGVSQVRIGHAYRLFPIEQYRDRCGVLTLHMHASRGCQRTCRYCPYIRIKGRWSARDHEGLADDVATLAGLGVDRLQFRDQDFASDAEHAVDVAQLIYTAGSGQLRWSVEGNLDRFTPPVLAAMVEAGCDEVIVGLESSDPEVLRSARRRVLSDTEERVHRVAAAGPRVRGLFMVGLPEDRWSRVLATVRRAVELPLTDAQFNVYAPLPGEKFGTDRIVTADDFVPNSNNYRGRTCVGMSAMEVRLAAGLATRAFAAHRAGDRAGGLPLAQIEERVHRSQTGQK